MYVYIYILMAEKF